MKGSDWRTAVRVGLRFGLRSGPGVRLGATIGSIAAAVLAWGCASSDNSGRPTLPYRDVPTTQGAFLTIFDADNAICGAGNALLPYEPAGTVVGYQAYLHVGDSVRLRAEPVSGIVASIQIHGAAASTTTYSLTPIATAHGEVPGETQVLELAVADEGYYAFVFVANGVPATLPAEGAGIVTAFAWVNEAEGCGEGLCLTGCPNENPCLKTDCDELEGCGLSAQADGSPCDDGLDCTSDECVAGECKSTLIDGCQPPVKPECDDATDCPIAFQPCTEAACTDGKCGYAPVPDGGGCDDGDECTTDACQQGVCVGTPIVGCGETPCEGEDCPETCGTAADCDAPDDACQVATCTGGVCGQDSADDGEPCDDGDACTQDACSGGACVGVAIPGCGEPACATALDCPASPNPCLQVACTDGACATVAAADGTGCTDGDVCTTDTCVAGWCDSEPIAGCGLPVCDEAGTVGSLGSGDPCTPVSCETSLDCPVIPGPCLDSACQAGACIGVPVDNGAACSDGEGCTTDACTDGACVGTLIPGCGEPICADGQGEGESCEPALCEDASDCPPHGNACLQASCAAGTCIATAVDDGAPCEDGEGCTVDECKGGQCVGTLTEGCGEPVCASPAPGACDPFVCDTAEDCPPHGNVCLQVACIAHTCVGVPGPDGAPCEDGEGCTDDECVAGQCVGTLIDGCGEPVCDPNLPGICDPFVCDTAEDCPPHGNVCLQVTCIANACIGVPGSDGAPCEDGEGCTDDECVAGQCVGTLIDGCGEPVCDPSSPGICDPFVCDTVADCPPHGNACLQVECIANTCVGLPGPDGNPCEDGDGCTTDVCIAGICIGTPIPGCGEPVCVDADLDGVCVKDGDCDDSNPKIHPGQPETCNNVTDDDCDGEVNEGCENTYCWVAGDWMCDDGVWTTYDACAPSHPEAEENGCVHVLGEHPLCPPNTGPACSGWYSVDGEEYGVAAGVATAACTMRLARYEDFEQGGGETTVGGYSTITPFAVQFNLAYDNSVVQLLNGFVDFCPAGVCIKAPAIFGPGKFALPTGHQVAITPELASTWNAQGGGSALIVNASSLTPLSEAFIDSDGVVNGEADFVELVYEVLPDAAPDLSLLPAVCSTHVAMSNIAAEPLAWEWSVEHQLWATTAVAPSASCDSDSDGYCAPEDCRPDDPLSYPGAPELCGNGWDDDCDGQADEGCIQVCVDNADCKGNGSATMICDPGSPKANKKGCAAAQGTLYEICQQVGITACSSWVPTDGLEYELEQGAYAVCTVSLAAATADEVAAGLQFVLAYDPLNLELVNGYDEHCFGNECYLIPAFFGGTQTLSTGHQFGLAPTSAAAWSAGGYGALVLVNLSKASTPITEAVLDGFGGVSGDPTVVEIVFRILSDVPGSPPIPCAREVQGADKNSLSLSVKRDADLGLWVTSSP